MPKTYDEEVIDMETDDAESENEDKNEIEDEEQAKPPSEGIQKAVIKFVREMRKTYETLNDDRNETLLEIYEAFSTYKQPKSADWKTTFKVNKAHEIVERVVPRLIAKNPRWIVTPNSFDFIKEGVPDSDGTPEGMAAIQEAMRRNQDKASEYAKSIGDYLDYIFNEYNFQTDIRLLAKNMVVYGKGRAKIGYKYETTRVWNDKKQIEERITGEHPFIEVKSWTEILTDPRYRKVRDMPGYIELSENVKFSELKNNEKKYFNLDKLDEYLGLVADGKTDEFKKRIQLIAGIEWTDTKDVLPKKNSLNLTTFYGYFCEEDEEDEKDKSILDKEEKWIKATLVNDSVLICYEEITRIPYVEADCFEDTETNFSVGFVEPILGLQDELNFRKNSAGEFINHALNRSWFWSPLSGVDPKDLISKPNNVIATSSSVSKAMENLKELEHRDLPASYFQESLDIERQIQGQTFTVDTSSQKGQQALTDTATGMRIEFFESNSVLDEVRKHLEQAFSELAYMLLQEAFENIEESIVFKKMGTNEYIMMHKEMLRDAIQKYKIRVEVGSSSFDDIENRRRDAMALGQMLKTAHDAGLNVNWSEWIIELLETFEKRQASNYITPPDIQQIAQKTANIGSPPRPQEQAQNPAAALTESVAKGDISSAVQ